MTCGCVRAGWGVNEDKSFTHDRPHALIKQNTGGTQPHTSVEGMDTRAFGLSVFVGGGGCTLNLNI